MNIATCKIALLAITAVLISVGAAFAQAPAARHKVLTPDQQHYQAECASWREQRGTQRVQAQGALSSETAREKIGDCPDANSTRAQEECLTLEIGKTQANYAAFAGSIRAMLALTFPTMPGEKPYSGPTGTPPSTSELLKEFEQSETDSKQYREHAVSAAYDQYKGGTLAPVAAMETEQKLLRLHFQEIAFIYGEKLSNH